MNFILLLLMSTFFALYPSKTVGEPVVFYTHFSHTYCHTCKQLRTNTVGWTRGALSIWLSSSTYPGFRHNSSQEAFAELCASPKYHSLLLEHLPESDDEGDLNENEKIFRRVRALTISRSTAQNFALDPLSFLELFPNLITLKLVNCTLDEEALVHLESMPFWGGICHLSLKESRLARPLRVEMPQLRQLNLRKTQFYANNSEELLNEQLLGYGKLMHLDIQPLSFYDLAEGPQPGYVPQLENLPALDSLEQLRCSLTCELIPCTRSFKGAWSIPSRAIEHLLNLRRSHGTEKLFSFISAHSENGISQPRVTRRHDNCIQRLCKKLECMVFAPSDNNHQAAERRVRSMLERFTRLRCIIEYMGTPGYSASRFELQADGSWVEIYPCYQPTECHHLIVENS